MLSFHIALITPYIPTSQVCMTNGSLLCAHTRANEVLWGVESIVGESLFGGSSYCWRVTINFGGSLRPIVTRQCSVSVLVNCNRS